MLHVPHFYTIAEMFVRPGNRADATATLSIKKKENQKKPKKTPNKPKKTPPQNLKKTNAVS